MNNTQLADQVLATMKGWMQRNVQPLFDRVKALEDRPLVVGEKGDPGERGADGAPGLAGKDGRDGIDGKDGAPGADGEPGATGPAGPQGERGEKGEKGDPGERGEPGPQGPAGEPGGPGPAGEKGADGIDGRDGREGEPGRDAVHVDVLDGIDGAKRYQRGTFASYRGGIIRAFKATDPLGADGDLERCGWHVVVRGIDDIAVTIGEDMRTVQLGLKMTDGKLVEKSLTTAAIVYRGVWKPGQYSAGDAVTREGSTWIARADTEATPGEGETPWQLAVKKGRDGRDGIRGEKGERGAEGRAGRDLTQLGPNGSKW